MKILKKRNIIFLLMILPFVACMSQTRVVDSSGKKPKWVHGLERGYIIAVGTGNTIQAAQRDALNMVREDIVNAVAVNVKTETEAYSEETNLNNNVNTFLEKFAVTTTTASGPVSYLQRITLSQVDEFYWEKTENRRDGTVRYNYHIKYPFSEFELQSLVMDFKRRDMKMNDQLNDIMRSIDRMEFETVEQIDKTIDELRVLADYFVDARKDRAQLGITRCRRLYESIELVEKDSRLGELKYALYLGDKIINSARNPQIRAECARVSNTYSREGIYIIEYDYDNCFEDPENHIMVRYRLGTVNVQRPFYFDVTAEKVSIFVNDPFHFETLSTSEEFINESRLQITIASMYEAPFTIEKVVIEWPDHAPVILDNIRQGFAGKGNHSLELFINQPLAIEKTTSSGRRISVLSGYVEYRNDVTGETKTYQVFNHRYSTNW